MTGFLVNMGAALLWTFLSRDPSLATFVMGWVLGFGVVCLGETLIPGSQYGRRVRGGAAFVVRFGVEFVRSSVELAAAVLLRSKNAMHPGLVRYDVRGLTPLEVLLLSHCISLTPGTTTLEVERAEGSLLLHAFDARDPERLRRSIDEKLKGPLLRWTR